MDAWELDRKRDEAPGSRDTHDLQDPLGLDRRLRSGRRSRLLRAQAGWEKRLDNPVAENDQFVTVALNSPHIAGRAPSDDTDVTLNVADIEGTCRTLVDMGVIFTKLLRAMPWGPRATWLRDPNGNTFFFIEG